MVGIACLRARVSAGQSHRSRTKVRTGSATWRATVRY